MSGYLGVGPEEGTFVPEDKAYPYALERCLHGTEEERKAFEQFVESLYFRHMPGWMRGNGGYIGTGRNEGIFVPYSEAYAYALFRLTKGTLEEQSVFREMLVEWYYSGNWIKEDLDGADC